MNAVEVPMLRDKKIALVAHDNKKRDLLECARFNRGSLAHQEVFATGTIGGILERLLGFEVRKLRMTESFLRADSAPGRPACVMWSRGFLNGRHWLRSG